MPRLFFFEIEMKLLICFCIAIVEGSESGHWSDSFFRNPLRFFGNLKHSLIDHYETAKGGLAYSFRGNENDLRNAIKECQGIRTIHHRC